MKLQDLLNYAVKQGASDIHLKTGNVPIMRKHGKLMPVSSKVPKLSAKHIEQLIIPMLNPDQLKLYTDYKVIDMGINVKQLGRFRLNIFRQMGLPRVVIRAISHKIPQLETLNLPPSIEKIANFERGLILVTGVTGSGKSTTLASLINTINQKKSKHILTIEDPVEYVFTDSKSIVTQRELGIDANNFHYALKAALRQDPDVILIGEMRDPETIETALNAASTGHLVFSTLHTSNAQETINRILGMMPAEKQGQIRLQFASALKAVLSQRLIPKKENDGFVPAVEILINNKRIQGLIEKPHRTSEISQVIAESRETYGMQSFDQSLIQLVTKDKIYYETAVRFSSSPEDFAIKFSGLNQISDKDKENTNAIAGTWTEIQTIELEPSRSKSKKSDD